MSDIQKLSVDDFLSQIPDKLEHKSTTSHAFKQDLLYCFQEVEWRSAKVAEIGTSQGWSTRYMANIFGVVFTLEKDEWNIQQAKEHCKELDNISFIRADAYRSDWKELFPADLDIVFIDCDHSYRGVQSDISNSLTILSSGKYLVFDDYGNPRTEGVKRAIIEAIEFGWIEEVVKIGHEPGTQIVSGADWTLEDYEGIICRVL